MSDQKREGRRKNWMQRQHPDGVVVKYKPILSYRNPVDEDQSQYFGSIYLIGLSLGGMGLGE